MEVVTKNGRIAYTRLVFDGLPMDLLFDNYASIENVVELDMFVDQHAARAGVKRVGPYGMKFTSDSITTVIEFPSEPLITENDA